MVFDEDHDFEGLSAPKAHLDPVLANVTNVLEQGSSSKLVSLYFKLYEFFFDETVRGRAVVEIARPRGTMPHLAPVWDTSHGSL